MQGSRATQGNVVDVPSHVLVLGASAGASAKVVAIMGHTKVETTLNVYTQVLDGAAREAADRVESGLFRIVQKPEMGKPLTH